MRPGGPRPGQQPCKESPEMRSSTRKKPIFGAAFWEELAVYAVLVGGYLLVVLRGLDVPLAGLFRQRRVLYAFAALALMLAQGVALEMLTGFLLRFFRRGR